MGPKGAPLLTRPRAGVRQLTSTSLASIRKFESYRQQPLQLLSSAWYQLCAQSLHTEVFGHVPSLLCCVFDSGRPACSRRGRSWHNMQINNIHSPPIPRMTSAIQKLQLRTVSHRAATTKLEPSHLTDDGNKRSKEGRQRTHTSRRCLLTVPYPSKTAELLCKGKCSGIKVLRLRAPPSKMHQLRTLFVQPLQSNSRKSYLEPA